ncbi:NADPH-dependent F420 reductase [Solimonas marina]|uniref:NAD(P)-binding domain-containing protein n=1 Tax=Solimonas marina TaxID=2714601 RepID=A0A969W926_9GAMM|nr:NAD(P)-binding domain-containing protein [Solimonas marina]NKF22243.1 NAD(P)-binding domain-containing protein [Solimonas marina]
MQIGVLGSGPVARALAAGFAARGHEVVLGTRDASRLVAWSRTQRGVGVASFAEAAAFGELLVLAVRGSVANRALRLAGTPNLAGKTIIDVCNPVADGASSAGSLRLFTSFDESLMERLQREFSTARFVKAFNAVGAAMVADPQLPGGPPTMFICGNDATAKAQVTPLLAAFGWEPADLGGAEAARVIEPMCLLWAMPAMKRGGVAHAFKLLRAAPGETHPA